jgi:hypothetical protein
LLISFAVCIVLFAVLALFIRASAALGGFGLIGLNGFGVFIGRGEKTDERDRSIARNASLGGFAASYSIFVLALMGVWTVAFIFHGRLQVSVHVLPGIVFLGGFTFYLVRAVAVLVGYRLHVEADGV